MPEGSIDPFNLACERVYISLLSVMVQARLERTLDGCFYLDCSDSAGRLKRQFIKEFRGEPARAVLIGLKGAISSPYYSRETYTDLFSPNARLIDDELINYVNNQLHNHFMYLDNDGAITERQLEVVFDTFISLTNDILRSRQKMPVDDASFKQAISQFTGCRESTSKPTYLMVRPDPSRSGHIDYHKAIYLAETDPGIKQYNLLNLTANYPNEFMRVHSFELLHRTLVALGANVTVIEREHTGRAAFPRDPLIALPDGRILIPGKKNNKIRLQAERDLYAEIFTRLDKSKIVNVSSNIEGGDIVHGRCKDGRTLYLAGGHGDMEVIEFVLEMDQLIDKKKTTLFTMPMKHEYMEMLAHVDCAANFLPDGTLAIFPDAFLDPDYRIERLNDMIGKENIILATKSEAVAGMLNFNVIGKTIVAPACSERLEGEYRRRGFEVLTPGKLGAEQEVFYYRGGGPRCMTMELFGEFAEKIRLQGERAVLSQSTTTVLR